jgi:hypothetical protein
MIEPMASSNADLLYRLATEAPFFNAREILLHIVARCKWILQQTDEKLTSNNHALPLLERIEGIDMLDQIFFFRSGPIRYQLESMRSLLSSNGETVADTLHSNQERLHYLLNNIIPSDRKQSDRLRWIESGFRSEMTLTTPFPLITTVWSSPHNDGYEEIDRTESIGIEAMFADTFGGQDVMEDLRLISFSPQQIGMLYDALSLLKHICPFILHDISMNVRHFCLTEFTYGSPSAFFTKPPVSFTTQSLWGACFFSAGAFSSLPLLTEAVYHETLHLKFFNLFCVQQMYAPGYPQMLDCNFACPWIRDAGGKEDLWPFERALAAFHVYVHLYVLYGAVLEMSSPMPNAWARDRRQTALGKAMILREWLESVIALVSTDMGQQFFSVMCSVFEASQLTMPSVAKSHSD